jgi:hypothetical protein
MKKPNSHRRLYGQEHQQQNLEEKRGLSDPGCDRTVEIKLTESELTDDASDIGPSLQDTLNTGWHGSVPVQTKSKHRRNRL